ncbi:nitrogen fixation protein NifQ [Acerihabitans sp. TG2]|uniref:nitrogen fixation protein NifQ n=1 Tax=Acerihabitans sp. TG2 TaxID=3096008 RepID=UPI002B231034|nr:nitrogen fixation protein NifQ [Acerihabitans sp. TG2]MEA9391011.1 nitrogen fixation protein NifQ [Acerihabitans sp. TG2]
MLNPPSAVMPSAPADQWLRCLAVNHLEGHARFPLFMGLSASDYQQLMCRVLLAPADRSAALNEQDRLLLTLQDRRRQECLDLAQWLSQYRVPDAAPLDRLIATASMGFNHLWQDLGLASRGELRQLMTDCFPELVLMNQQNMRWKKFFYRQLCLIESGEINCRSPSCDSCCEQASCFSPED